MIKMRIAIYLLLATVIVPGTSCRGRKDKTGKQEKSQNMKKNNIPVTLMTLDPGHFHAALVQKYMYGDQVKPQAYVFAPEGPEVRQFLNMINRFNTRTENPTAWKEKVYTGPDFLDRMLKEKPGNVVVISGNNARKTEYIKRSIENGLNVFADKPMVITPERFPDLEEAFRIAGEKGVLLYDIMTERYEITSVLQKELAQIPEIFGKLQQGTPEQPALVQESIHRFYKNVAGKPLIRPAWFFDISQQGEAIADVGTHLVDLIQWEAFPGQIIHKDDIRFLSASHWPTPLTQEQFQTITGLDMWPDFLMKYVKNDTLQVFSSGEVIYTIKGITAKVKVTWTYHTPESSDAHYSIMRGTGCDLIIKQGKEENYHPTLYVRAAEGRDPGLFERELVRVMAEVIATKYPGVDIRNVSEDTWAVTIPERYDVGHEAHFRQVMEKFLEYLRKGNMPAWEVPDMITKYYITTEALRRAREKDKG